MGRPEHPTCLLRNLYAGQEATVRTGHGTTDWFQIGKGVRQDCILSPCLFNLYAEYIMWNARKTFTCFTGYTKVFDCVDHSKQREILKEMGIPDHPTCLLWNLYADQEATVRTGHRTTDIEWQTLRSWAPKSLQMVTAATKRHLLFQRKTMTNLDSILKSWDSLCQQRSV